MQRDDVLAAAERVVAADGLGALTMRRLAADLGVTPMAVYRHVADRQALLDLLVERVLERVPLPAPDLPWHERLTLLARGVRSLAALQPDLVPLLLARPATTPGALRTRDAVLVALRDAGVPDDDAARWERLLSTLVLGWAASEAGGRLVDADADFEWSLQVTLDQVGSVAAQRMS